MKIWLIRKIEKIELELKYLKALLIMLSHVENAVVDSDTDSDYSIKTGDIQIILIIFKMKSNLYHYQNKKQSHQMVKNKIKP